MKPGLRGAALALGLWLVAAGALATPAEFDALWRQLDLRGVAGQYDQATIDGLKRLRALQPAGDAYRGAQMRYLDCLAQSGDRKAAYEAALQWEEQAAASADLAAQVMANTCRLWYFDSMGEDTPFLPAANKLLGLAHELGQPLWIGRALEYRGDHYSVNGDQAHAVLDLLTASDTYSQAGMHEYARALLLLVGTAYRRVGDYANAESFLNRALANADARGSWQDAVAARLQLAFMADTQGLLPEAEALFQRALEQARHQEAPEYVATGLMGLGHVKLRAQEPRAALMHVQEARRLRLAMNDHIDDTLLAHFRGAAMVQLGQLDAGLRLLDRAVADMTSGNQRRYLAEALADRAQAHELLGHTDAALRDLKRLLALRTELDANLRDQQSLLARERFAAAERQAENARLQAAQHSQAIRLEAEIQTRRWQGAALVASALLLLGLLAVVWRQVVRGRRLHAMTVTDSLTQVLNRRGIEALAASAIADARRAHTPLCVLTFDIDHFKHVNDELGHVSGDVVLTRVAAAARSAIRHYDQIGRVGGEEFMALLPGADLATASHIGERMRQQVEALDWSDMKPGMRVTLSWGLTALRDSDMGLADALKRADAALYEAKHNGRNQGVAVP